MLKQLFQNLLDDLANDMDYQKYKAASRIISGTLILLTFCLMGMMPSFFQNQTTSKRGTLLEEKTKNKSDEKEIDYSQFNFLFKNNNAKEIAENIINKKQEPNKWSNQDRDRNDFFRFYLQNTAKVITTKYQISPSVVRFDANKDLKFSSYKKAVNEHLRIALKVALNKAPLQIQTMFKKIARFLTYYLEITPDGGIKHLMLSCPSKIPELDDFLLGAIKSAVPFPSIPKHLGISSYVVTE